MPKGRSFERPTPCVLRKVTLSCYQEWKCTISYVNSMIDSFHWDDDHRGPACSIFISTSARNARRQVRQIPKHCKGEWRHCNTRYTPPTCLVTKNYMPWYSAFVSCLRGSTQNAHPDDKAGSATHCFQVLENCDSPFVYLFSRKWSSRFQSTVWKVI